MTKDRRWFVKTSAAAGTALAAAALGCGGAGAEAGTAATSGSTATTGSTTTTTIGMRDLGSVALSRLMGAGWNLGNSLEATGGETAWGNAATTPTLLKAVRVAGFDTLRIPVAWKQYADADDRIRGTWMARVTQVVDDARAAGFFVVINIHWDGGWIQPTYAAQADVNARLRRYWTQIAENFRAHDDMLLFAGTNEVMKEGDYGTPTVEYRTVQNGYNQVFVDTVRATGGNNRVRHLVVQGFNTNIDHTLNFAVLPTDVVAERLMMEVHYYDPYQFTLDTAPTNRIWQWGATATDPAAKVNWGDEAWADRQFQRMKERYVDRGVGVLLGEYGVVARPKLAGRQAYRLRWNEYITRSARAHRLVPVYWDNGVNDEQGMGLFDRATGAQTEPALVSAIVQAGR